MDLLSQCRRIHTIVQANPPPTGHRLGTEAVAWRVAQESGLKGQIGGVYAVRAVKFRDRGWGVGLSKET